MYLCSMKRAAVILMFAVLCSLHLSAWEYVSEETKSELTGQLRLDLTYTLPLPHGCSLSFFEDLRFDMLPFSPATVFDLSLTSVTFAYSPVQYVKLDAGYMLKLIGAGSAASWHTHWNKPASFVKHRLYAGITGSYRYGNWRFALRERLLCDMRFDDIDLRTTNRYALTLRHFITVSYNFREKHVTPYLWVELANTLNATEYCRKNGMQYLERWRNCAGVRWRIVREEKQDVTLNFFYRYDWGCFRSARLVGDDAALTVRRRDEHALGFGIEL